MQRVRVPPQIRTDERTDRGDPQTFLPGRLERGFDEAIAEVMPSKRGRHFRVHESHRVRVALVIEECRLTVFHDLEPACGAVVRDGLIPVGGAEVRRVKADTRAKFVLYAHAPLPLSLIHI